ncbi:kinase-like domain-containing protein [Mycena galericulata]|nr:kinase-like domain-containing protein [Mycena galericulata]
MKNADLENEHTPQSVVVPRAFLVVHGLRSKAHAEEVCEVVESLQRRLKKNMQRDFRIGIVVVTKSTLLRHVADSPAILDRFCTMHVPGGDGPLIYSGVTPSPPMLYEKIFLLLVDGLHRLGGVDAERIWPRLLQISEEGTAWRLELEGVPLSTHTIFAKLFGALRARKEITECLSEMRGMTRALVPKKMIEDHIKIGSVLQELFVLNTYQQEIESVNKEHAGAVLNITHKILDDGLPPNDVVPNWNQFSRRAHRLLNTLAAHLDMLPEELSVNNVLLLSNHIVKSGGFSNVYRGRYTKADGEEVEIALKVLRIFDDQTAESRRLLYEKFNKEALLWHHMKHPNVVHFLGVDSTTFPSPARAMVSPWMAQGSVLKYIADPENSPVAPYAIELLCDVIEGLRYLHSSNVVHGDLCGRNILINEHGEACLTDFGLAGFIESDTTNRAASTRGGSIRWMPPELLVVAPGTQFRRSLASDIWAFGCVCGEIWTEGILPFATEQEMAIIFLFSSHDSATEDESPSGWPYQQRPADKVGNLMPERLWELVQWCWKYDAAARPSTGVIADMLSEMNPGKRRKGGEDSKVVAEANAAVGAARGVAGGSGMRRVRDEDEDGDGVVSSASATSMSSDEEDLTPPASSAPKNKGKQRAQAMVPLPSRAVHFTNADEPSDSDLFVARFGPLPEGMEFGAGHEDVEFLEIFEALAGRVGRSGALAEPRSVHRFDNTHLDLHFKTAMEANNFAMTWMNRRFEPYLECEAFVVDID